MTDIWDKDVRLMGRNHETFCDTTINLKQARVKGTLRKRLSKEDLEKIRIGVGDYVQSHPENVGTIEIIMSPDGEIIETNRSK